MAGKISDYLFKRFARSPKMLALGMTLFPPLGSAGVRVRNISDDWTHAEAHLNLQFFNRNMHGAAFGGTLFSMTDAIFGTLVMKRLGPEYEAWTRTGTFQYLNPGRSGAKAIVDIDEEIIEQIREEIEADGFSNIPFTTVIENLDGSIAGIGQQSLHCRKRKSREANRSHAEQATGSSRPRRVRGELSVREPRGIALAAIATALVWRALGDDPNRLTEILSEKRRIPLPDDQAAFVADVLISGGHLTREEVLEAKIPERLLPAVTSQDTRQDTAAEAEPSEVSHAR